MSNRTSRLLPSPSIRMDLEQNIESLTRWLSENGLENSEHTDQTACERLAWHYGYLIALRDVRDLLAAA